MNPLTPQSVQLPPFVPRRGFRSGHLMTFGAWRRMRHYPGLPAAEPRFFKTAPDTTVLAHMYWQEDRAAKPTLLEPCHHGIEGFREFSNPRGIVIRGKQADHIDAFYAPYSKAAAMVDAALQ